MSECPVLPFFLLPFKFSIVFVILLTSGYGCVTLGYPTQRKVIMISLDKLDNRKKSSLMIELTDNAIALSKSHFVYLNLILRLDRYLITSIVVWNNCLFKTRDSFVCCIDSNAIKKIRRYAANPKHSIACFKNCYSQYSK